MAAHTLFPNTGVQALSACVHLLGVSVLSFFLSERMVSGEDSGGRRSFVRPTWPRLCVLLVLLDSWLFLFSTGLLIFGVGLQMNKIACAAGVYLCVIFYCTSKVLIYLFLTEKVYIVWGKGVKRMRSPVYLVCLISVVMYAAVMLAMFFGRIHHFRDGDEACILGLKPTASLPLLSYDLYINVLLTTLFIWPILRSKHSTMQMRGVATRTLIAAGVALTTSTVNIAVLTILHGKELGWVCLGSCGTDVIFNAAALFYCTAGRGGARTGLSGTPSAGRQVSGSESANGITLAPGTPSRPNHNINFKSASDMYPMADMASPGRREFKIHVTTTTEEQSDIDKGDIAGEHGRTSPK